MESTLAQLLSMRRKLLAKRNGAFVVSLTGDEGIVSDGAARVDAFIDSVTIGGGECDAAFEEWKVKPVGSSRVEGFAVPAQINFVSKSVQLYSKGECIPGAIAIAVSILRTGYIWENIRVIGGAYGGMVRFDRSTGTLAFVSYRDPNIGESLAVYDAAGDALLEYVESMSDDDLELAIIGTIGSMDAPMSPDQEGHSSLVEYLSGRSRESKQALREEILSCTRDDLRDVALRIRGALTSHPLACALLAQRAL